MNKILLIGGLPNEKYNCQYGGATVLMKNLYDYFVKKGVSFQFVQTNKFINHKTLELIPWKNNLWFFVNFLWYIIWCDVAMFNFSDHATAKMYPILNKIAKALGKKTVLRKFGGSFALYLENKSASSIKKIEKALKQTDLIFLETKDGIAHMNKFIKDEKNVIWFPNVRKAAPVRKNPHEFSKKLVFMSHVSNEKGVGALLEAFKELPEGYELDFYGAIKEDCYRQFDWDAHGVSYKGEISSADVLKLLPNYQLLLLITSHREGYPGIVIESLSVGVPVITTKVGGIPEIIQDGYNGRLVDIGNISQIVNAICSFNENNYPTFSDNAYKSFCDFFESDNVNERILKNIINLS